MVDLAIVDPVIRAGALQGFKSLVEGLGGDPAAMLKRHTLPPTVADEPETMIPLIQLAAVLEDAAQNLDCPDFGLRLGAMQDPEMLGVLAVVLQGAGTSGAALVDASRYLFVHSPAYGFTISPPDKATHGREAVIRFDIRIGPGAPVRQLVDGCLASTFALAQALTGRSIRPTRVTLPHTPVAPGQCYRSFFGSHVAFEQPNAEIHVDRDFLEIDLRATKPQLRQRAIAYLALHHPPGSTSTANRVRSMLQGTIGANRGRKTEIASLMSLHPRTLQRLLKAENETFESLRDEVYRTATWRVLAETAVPFPQAALALGFSEQSAMNRSVRRWFGVTPTQIRLAYAKPLTVEP